MENKAGIILKPSGIRFTGSCIKLRDSRSGEYRIPYKDLVLAGIRIYDKFSGSYYEPELTDITKDMEGDLILYDFRHVRWQINTEVSGKRAGALIEELAVRWPCILIGKQTWADIENEGDFEEIGNMVRLMGLMPLS